MRKSISFKDVKELNQIQEFSFNDPPAHLLTFRLQEPLEIHPNHPISLFSIEITCVLSLFIKVANLSFHKQVSVIYSRSNWASFDTIDAFYKHSSGNHDYFTAKLDLVKGPLSFCIKFVCDGNSYFVHLVNLGQQSKQELQHHLDTANNPGKAFHLETQY